MARTEALFGFLLLLSQPPLILMKAFLLDGAITLLEGLPASETATKLKDTTESLHSFSSSTPGLLVSATKKVQGGLRDTLTKP